MRTSLRSKLLAGAAAGVIAASQLLPALAATTLNSTLKACISGHYVGSNAVNPQVQDIPESACYAVAMAQGTGTGQADTIYVGRRTLTASSTETLDLAGSGASLTDPFGTSISFLHVKAVYIRAAAGNTNDVVVGNAGSNPFLGPMAGTTPTSAAKPGGVILWLNAAAAGWAVADGSNDNLKVANSSSGTSVTYDLIIVGTSS